MSGQPATDILARIERLNAIGIALSAERDTPRLLEQILLGAKAITDADAGTLYLMNPDGRLAFAIMRTDSKDLMLGGSSGQPIPYEPIDLYDDQGRPNHRMVAAYAALTGETVNVADAYRAQGFDFAGTRAFDARIGYRSQSFLTVPMRNHESDTIGVLQLINKIDRCGDVVAFGEDDERLANSLASQAAVALTNQRLIDELQALFESFVRLIATAIDEKSPYTGGHCKRVPVLTRMLAQAASETNDGPLKNFTLSAAALHELDVAAWLHDCGKITTPEYVMDKATKLETVFDRIVLVDVRFEILRRDAEIGLLRGQLQAQCEGRTARVGTAIEAHEAEVVALRQERDFLRSCNIGGEDMAETDRERLATIGHRAWTDMDGKRHPLLTENELHNLSISKGTLTREERAIINNHIDATIRMLEALPFPKHLRNVPEYAGGHHERMDGKGYPRGLRREQMSIPARVMAIADIFEALTAGDRPYKKPKPLSEALQILGDMKQAGHIDPDLFDVFIAQRLYRRYGEAFLEPEQLDIVEPTEIPGYPFK